MIMTRTCDYLMRSPDHLWDLYDERAYLCGSHICIREPNMQTHWHLMGDGVVVIDGR